MTTNLSLSLRGEAEAISMLETYRVLFKTNERRMEQEKDESVVLGSRICVGYL
jgi:hypothetical protein